MTPDPRKGHRRVTVGRSEFGPEDRHVARLEVDGTPWSWECPHLHHSEGAAARCVPVLAAEVEEWLGDEAVTVTEVRPGLVELAVPRQTEPGRFNLPVGVVTVTKRVGPC